MPPFQREKQYERNIKILHFYCQFLFNFKGIYFSLTHFPLTVFRCYNMKFIKARKQMKSIFHLQSLRVKCQKTSFIYNIFIVLSLSRIHPSILTFFKGVSFTKFSLYSLQAYRFELCVWVWKIIKYVHPSIFYFQLLKTVFFSISFRLTKVQNDIFGQRLRLFTISCRHSFLKTTSISFKLLEQFFFFYTSIVDNFYCSHK